jgi:hypothetical protein
MEDSLDSELREKIDKLSKSIIKIFPNYGGIPGGEMGDGINPIRSFKIDHIDNNRRYKDSKYYFTKHKLGIHYTSIDALFSILRSKKLRLHSLSGMDDIKELSYARNIIVGKNEIEQEKEKKGQRYIFSFCDYQLEEDADSLALWREYGDDGYGCGIVFSIDTNTMDKWENYHFSKIFYKEKDLEPIRTAYNEYLKINNHQNTRVFGFEDIIVSLYGFHKSPIFDYEKELRLLYVHRDDYINTFNESSFPYFKNGKDTSCIELDLGHKSMCYRTMDMPEQRKELLSRIKPDITIAKIIFGYRLTKADASILTKQIVGYARELPNGEKIKVGSSPITKYYQ